LSAENNITSDEFLAREIENYTDPDFVSVKNFATAGVRSSDTIPKGRYFNTEMQFTDVGNGYTNITVSYVQYREWKLIKIIDKVPSPKGGA
ncbi:MAG: hypothetical protein PHI35_08785, partial [Victivallaceae bacterium]|nr:hypothetical protein [Victivallaceae bacterium]